MESERKPDRFEPCARRRQVIGIEIEANKLSRRSNAAKQFDRVPTESDGAIDDDLTGPRIEGGEHFGQHHGPMFALRS
jgi:hypothetical protein